MKRLSLISMLAVLMAGYAVAQDGTALPRLEGVALDDLTATWTKPLFSPDRQPPVPEVQEEADTADTVVPEPPIEAGAAPPEVTLVGVVIAGSETLAVLRDSDGRMHRLRSGEGFEGWTMTVVDSLSISLDNGESRILRALFETGHAASSARRIEEKKEENNAPTELWR